MNQELLDHICSLPSDYFSYHQSHVSGRHTLVSDVVYFCPDHFVTVSFAPGFLSPLWIRLEINSKKQQVSLPDNIRLYTKWMSLMINKKKQERG